VVAQALKPFNLEAWIEDHREELAPPVNAKTIFEDSETYVIMAIGGPNDRPDFHQNETEEYFRQVKGDMVLKVKPPGEPIQDIVIREGEVLLLPANTVHSPRRPADTIGVVVERVRESHHIDRLFWFCDNCEAQLHAVEIEGVGNDLGPSIAPFIDEYYDTEALRTCSECGLVNPGKS
jgi:3-hydroxyanthranilate 3,4-dioxygenase